jgi:hypothetical protein
MGEIDVHLGIGVHPGIDRVLHGEVSGFTDEETPGERHTAVGHRGASASCGVDEGMTPR